MDIRSCARPGRPVWRRREVVPIVVLLVAALTFAAAVASQGLTTWTGPGFSMFSNVDYDRTRWVRVEATTSEGSGPAERPNSTDSLLERLKHEPTEAHARELANAYLQSEWFMQGDTMVPGSGEPAESVSLVLVNVFVSGDEVVTKELLRIEVAR